MEKPFYQSFKKKVLALLLAVTLWTVANLEFDVESNVSIPLHLVNLPSNLIVVNKLPENVELTLRGHRNELHAFARSNIDVLSIDMGKTKTGLSKINMERLASDTIPGEIDIISTKPVMLSLNVDRIVTKNLMVEPVFGEPDSGYEVSGIKVVPAFVEVRGPSRELRKFRKIETTKIKLSGEETNFTTPASLRVPLQMEALQGNLVDVTISLRELTVTKEFKNVSINVRNFEKLGFNSQSDLEANLIFDGPYKTINELKSSEVKVFVDGNDMGGRKEKDIQVKVDYPKSTNLKLSAVRPKTIKVTVTNPGRIF